MGKGIIKIGISAEKLSEAERQIAGLGGSMDKILEESQNAALEYAKQNVYEFIARIYAIEPKEIRKASRIRSRRSAVAGIGRLTSLSLSSNKIGLYKYDGTSPLVRTDGQNMRLIGTPNGWNYLYESEIASGRQLRSTPPRQIKASRSSDDKYDLSDGFIADMPNRHRGIFQRVKGLRRKDYPYIDKIREVAGSSASQMLENKDVREPFTEAVQKVFDETFDSEVKKVLNGGGGQ